MKDEVIYEGLGFPVRLLKVKTQVFRGEVLPDLNHRELEDRVFHTLLWRPAHLSGAHLAFIRGYLKLSQKDLATQLGLRTHATISAWERKGQDPTGMPVATEILLRLLMADFVQDHTFATRFKEYLDLEDPPEQLEMDVA